MGEALREAGAAIEHGDVPVGALVVDLVTGAIVARAHNTRERDGDPTAHAELRALRAAARYAGTWRLGGHALVVTLEPCPMCAGAAVAARIGAVAYGATDPKGGALGTLYDLSADPRLNHAFPVEGDVRADESAALLREFFASRRGTAG